MVGAPELVFSDAQKVALLGFARSTLEVRLSGARHPSLAAFLEASPLDSPWLRVYPCFVSLFSRSHRLRGCIGCTETEATLAANVHRLVQHAAFEDPRFPSVSAEELSNLYLRISVLGPSLPLPSLKELELGRHGLSVRLGSRRGVLLAEVARQYGWSKERFLHETLLKAGLRPSDGDRAAFYYFEEIEFGEITD